MIAKLISLGLLGTCVGIIYLTIRKVKKVNPIILFNANRQTYTIQGVEIGKEVFEVLSDPANEGKVFEVRAVKPGEVVGINYADHNARNN